MSGFSDYDNWKLATPPEHDITAEEEAGLEDRQMHERLESMAAENARLKEENLALRIHAAEINNRVRHEWAAAVDAATSHAFKAMAWPHAALRELSETQSGTSVENISLDAIVGMAGKPE